MLSDTIYKYLFLEGTNYNPVKHDEVLQKPKQRYMHKELNMLGLPLIYDTKTVLNYLQVIIAAKKSQPTPDQSGFYVYTGAMTASGKIVYGGNHEKGVGKQDTITHGEEAVIARALDDYGINDQISIIGFLRKTGFGLVPRHCGSCRDAILKYDPSKIKIFGASEEGGYVIVLPFSNYLKEDFDETDDFKKFSTAEIKQGLAGITIASYRGISQDIMLEEKMKKGLYGAAIVAKNGNMWKGSFRGDTAYHSSYTISAAIDTFRNTNPKKEDTNIERLVLVSIDEQPKIPYKDRQFFLDFAESVQLFNDKGDEPLPIYLLQANQSGEVIKGWKTDSYEWLPLPFSAKVFGLGNSLVQNIGALVNQ